MKARRNIYSLTLMFVILAAMLPGLNNVRSQTLSAPLLNRDSGSVAFESRPPLQNFAELKSTLLIKDSVYVEAYFDVTRILSEKNSCSDFFGGSDTALEVFTQLAATMTKTYIPANIGIRMSGDYSILDNRTSGIRYRRFNKAEINVRGSFYHQKMFAADPFVPSIGSFRPNTRAARALMLLHELGHLIEVRPGQWLLPNDGNKPAQSTENTWRVEKQCGQVIRALPYVRPAVVAQSGKPGQD